jgi:hypothetical protein
MRRDPARQIDDNTALAAMLDVLKTAIFIHDSPKKWQTTAFRLSS